MKNVKSLIKNWSLPDRSQDRSQLTLRLNYELYAKLQALKEIYPTRSINDLITDILQVGIDEIVEALPIYTRSLTPDEIAEAAFHSERPMSDFTDATTSSGPGVDFQNAYTRILSQKSESESKIDEAA